MSAEDENRGGDAQRPHLVDDLKAVHALHNDIQQDQIEALFSLTRAMASGPVAASWAAMPSLCRTRRMVLLSPVIKPLFARKKETTGK